LNMSGNFITNVASPVTPYINTNIATIGYIDLCMPIGSIIMWNKSTIPANWRICDGNNGTPNLTNRFIMGTQQTTVFPTRTGGVSTATLDTNTMPSHTHSLSFSQTLTTTSNNYVNIQITDAGHSHQYTATQLQSTGEWAPSNYANDKLAQSSGGDTSTNSYTLYSNESSGHSHTYQFQTTTSSFGTAASFQLLPAYYVLLYIQRVQ